MFWLFRLIQSRDTGATSSFGGVISVYPLSICIQSLCKIRICILCICDNICNLRSKLAVVSSVQLNNVKK